MINKKELIKQIQEAMDFDKLSEKIAENLIKNGIIKDFEETDIELINKYSRKELSEDDVYIFNVTLCDNDIDRDFECFTKETLDGLAELFLGKPGRIDFGVLSEQPEMRIFKTWVENIPDKQTRYGSPYYKLRARAYIKRANKDEDMPYFEVKNLIEQIENGEKKEVDIGCAIEEIECSVCGSNLNKHNCGHIRGNIYSGLFCYGILKYPYDAYEWGFKTILPSELK